MPQTGSQQITSHFIQQNTGETLMSWVKKVMNDHQPQPSWVTQQAEWEIEANGQHSWRTNTAIFYENTTTGEPAATVAVEQNEDFGSAPGVPYLDVYVQHSSVDRLMSAQTARGMAAALVQAAALIDVLQAQKSK